MTKENSAQSAERLSELAWKPEPGVIIDDLIGATEYVAEGMEKRYSLKGFAQGISAELVGNDLTAVWQKMADAVPDITIIDRAETATPERDVPEDWKLIHKIIDTAHAIHRGEAIPPNELAGKGLRKWLKRSAKATSEPVSEVIEDRVDLVFSGILGKAFTTAAAREKIQSVHDAEAALRREQLRYGSADSYFYQRRDAFLDARMQLRDPDRNSVIVPNVGAKIARLSDTEHDQRVEPQTISRQDVEDYYDGEDRIDNYIGFTRIIDALDSTFGTAAIDQREAVSLARREALDVITEGLLADPESTIDSPLKITEANLPAIAAALVLTGLIPSNEAVGFVEVMEPYYAYLEQLLIHNPKQLLDHPEFGLIKIKPGSATASFSTQEGANTMKTSLRLKGLVPVNGTSLEEREVELISSSSITGDVQHSLEGLSECAMPITDFETYTEKSLNGDAAQLYLHLGVLFANDWEHLPSISEEYRDELREAYSQNHLRGFMSNLWSYCCNMGPLDFLDGAAGAGTAHELVEDPLIYAQIASLDAQLWMVKNPQAAQAELRLQGFEPGTFAVEIRRRVLELLRTNAATHARVTGRYAQILSHYINTIFDFDAVPRDYILSNYEIETNDEKARSWDARFLRE